MLRKMAPNAEDKLLDACRQGSPVAWDELFERHYAPVGRFVFQLASDLTRQDVEEICQESFLSAIRHIQSFKGDSQFQTWLFRIASNKTRDYLEKQNALKRGGGRKPASLDAEDPDTGLSLDPPSPSDRPDEELLRIENVMLVGQAMQLLGDSCREVIELRYFGDLSYREISNALNLNEKTVSSRLSKCLDKLEIHVRELFSREKTPISPSNK